MKVSIITLAGSLAITYRGKYKDKIVFFFSFFLVMGKTKNV